MKTRLLVVLGSIGLMTSGGAPALYSLAAASGAAAPSAQDEIRKIEQDRNHAILTGDTATLDRMTSSDYTFITQRGELRSKADILKGFDSGSFRYAARQVSDLTIRVYGNTAVVTGRASQQGSENSKDYSGENRFTRVYVKEGGHWVSVALQVTLIEKPSASSPSR